MKYDEVNRGEFGCCHLSQSGSNENILQCSKSCGSGLQRRRVECTMRRGNHGPEMTVKDEQCSRLGLAKPRSQRPCRRIACDYIWQEDAWSEVPSLGWMKAIRTYRSCFISSPASSSFQRRFPELSWFHPVIGLIDGFTFHSELENSLSVRDSSRKSSKVGFD